MNAKQTSILKGHIHWQGSRARMTCHVSNGEHIVEVSKSNTYELPFITGRHRFVFVIPPDGYRCITPFWSYCLDGRDKPEQTDFCLQKMARRPGRGFTALHVTDIHVDGRKTDTRIAKWLRTLPPSAAVMNQDFPTTARMEREIKVLIEQSPTIAFGVVTGDITNWGEPSKLKAAARVLASMPIPFYPVFGGHDGDLEYFSNGAGFNAKFFMQHMAPPYYSWHWGGRHFIAFMCESRFIDQPTKQLQDAFIAEDLRRFGQQMPVTVCTHKHPFPFNVGVFRRYHVDSWLHGHMHSSRLMHDGQIRVFSTGATAMGNIDLSDVHGRVIKFPQHGKPTSRPLRLLSSPSKPRPRQRQSPIKIVWRSLFDRTARLAQPCVTDDLLYCGTTDETSGTQGGVIALDRRTGKPRWQRPLGESVESPVILYRDRLVAVTQAGRVACLRRLDGKTLWQRTFPDQYNRWIYSTPLIIGNHVVIGTSSFLACLSLRTGRKRWCLDEGGVSASDAMGRFASPAADGNRILIIGPQSHLLDAKTGQPLGHVQNERSDALRSRSLSHQGRYVVGGSIGYLCCFEIKTGRRLWRQRISQGGIISAFVPYLGSIVGGTADGVGRYSFVNGRRLAARSFGKDARMFVPYRTRARSCMGSPVVESDRLWVASGDGYMNLLQGRSLDLVGRVALPAPMVCSLAAHPDGSIYGTDADGHILCFRYTGAEAELAATEG